MLGKHVKVNVYGVINDKGVYSGYISSNLLKNKIVYIVSKKRLSSIVSCVIIATTKKISENSTSIIVAPDREIFYEPELKIKLSNVKNIDVQSLYCLYEKSCGAVVVNHTSQGRKILLIKNRNAKYWSFPKGHIETGESEIQTAIREVKEETGLDIRLYKNYRQISDYNPYGKIRKRVIFFMGETSNSRVIKQEDEIDSYIWVTFKQAEKICCYENDKKIIRTAQQYLRKKKRKKTI